MAEEDGLSEYERLQVKHATVARMLQLLAEDERVSALATLHPDEIVTVYMAGCQAGSDAALRILEAKAEL